MCSIRRAVLALAAVATVSFLGACAVEREREKPATPRLSSVEDLTRASDLVIVGKVLRNDARWVGGHIVTTSQVAPIETLKGEAAAKTVPVSFLGGTVGNINQHVNHEATLWEGQVAVLFLRRAREFAGQPLDTARIVSGQGVITLVRPGERESRLANNRRLVRKLDDIRARVGAAGE